MTPKQGREFCEAGAVPNRTFRKPWSGLMPHAIDRRTALAGLVALSACAGRAEAVRSPVPQRLSLQVASGRISQVSVWRAARPRGTILFSHGALSSPAKYQALLAPWAAAGFDVWAPLHVDSTDHPDTADFPGLASWPARLEDMAALAAHVGAPHPVAAGHSYGGLVALTMGGAAAERPSGYLGPMRDPRVRAVVAFSPPGPIPGLVSTRGYAALAVPALIQTGTADVPPAGMSGEAGWRAHLAAFDAAEPGGDRFALVLDAVDHYFGGLICQSEVPGPRQSMQLVRAVEVSTLFLQGYGERLPAPKRALISQLGRQGPGELFAR